MNIEELQSLQERVKKLEKSIVEKMSTMQKNIAFISIFQKILNIILIFDTKFVNVGLNGSLISLSLYIFEFPITSLYEIIYLSAIKLK